MDEGDVRTVDRGLVSYTSSGTPPSHQEGRSRWPTQLQKSWDVLASRNHITIQLDDRLPAPLGNVNNTNKDDLILCYPPNADPPIWILSFKSLGLLQPVEMYTLK